MNAEALIGMTLGTCTLQRLVGQGGMGAVFLAQQSRPRRQVAVKVLFPATSLTPNQLAAFLERFRRETDAAASLEHPNIMPVHEYGEQNGLAYLVMPYISGGTLRDEMEREGALGLAKTLNYLEQLASALDCAHERGVIHRDVKPANILKTPDSRLLLTDFGLVKVISEEQATRVRLTGPGAPVGTPDYMSPEQVLGQPVDGRADLYSLGVILYQMVTGTTPFRGDMPMQIAAQHLQTPPLSPRMLRGDLPIAAEQVMLRALAKQPGDRYGSALELGMAFRGALSSAGVSVDTAPSMAISPPTTGNTASRLFAPKGLFDPKWQTGTSPAVNAPQKLPTGTFPTVGTPARSTGLLSRTGMFPAVGTGALAAASADTTRPPTGALPGGTGVQPAVMSPWDRGYPPLTGTLSTASGMQPAVMSPDIQPMSPSFMNTTGALMAQGAGQATSGLKLTGPVKVVQVPVPGQPGRFVTGLLPVLPQTQPPAETDTGKRKPWNGMKLIAAVVVLLLVLGSSGVFVWGRLHSGQNTKSAQNATTAMANPLATATAQSMATASANIILSDPLSQNIHNWPTTPANKYAFTGGAYHITDRNDNGLAVVLQSQPFTGPLGYTLTMQEIKGDDGNINNSFGMIIRFKQQTKGGKTVTQFYSFEVVNTKGGRYRFYKYDDSKGTGSPWTQVWSKNFGKEFHQGHGANTANTVKIYTNGKNFTFTVNGHQVGTAQDGSFPDGTVGMLVNLNGTEVAFQNMLITRN